MRTRQSALQPQEQKTKANLQNSRLVVKQSFQPHIFQEVAVTTLRREPQRSQRNAATPIRRHELPEN